MFGANGQAAGGALAATPSTTLTPGTPLPASTAEAQCNHGNGGTNAALFYFTLRAGT